MSFRGFSLFTSYRSMRAAATPASATELPTLTIPAPAVVAPVPVPVVLLVLAEPVPVVPPVEPPEVVPPGAVLEVAWAAIDLKLARDREALAAVLQRLLLVAEFHRRPHCYLTSH